jgi:aspartate 1-decarboxylase
VIRRFVRGVIQNATVTEVEAGWPVALRIDPILMRAIDVLPLEAVQVVNTETGIQFATWVEPATEAGGEVRLHGSGARKGDVVTIISHGMLHDGQTLSHRAKIVTLDADNRILALIER